MVLFGPKSSMQGRYHRTCFSSTRPRLPSQKCLMSMMKVERLPSSVSTLMMAIWKIMSNDWKLQPSVSSNSTSNSFSILCLSLWNRSKSQPWSQSTCFISKIYTSKTVFPKLVSLFLWIKKFKRSFLIVPMFQISIMKVLKKIRHLMMSAMIHTRLESSSIS